MRSLSDMGLGLSVVHPQAKVNGSLGLDVGQHKVTCYGASVRGKSLISPTYLPSQIIPSEYGDSLNCVKVIGLCKLKTYG